MFKDTIYNNETINFNAKKKPRTCSKNNRFIHEIGVNGSI